MSKAPDDDREAIWVKSSPAPGGGYAAAVYYGDRQIRVLDYTAAVLYAATVQAAATRTEHDAAVVAQLIDTGVERTEVVKSLGYLRRTRPSVNGKATAPLSLKSFVSAARGTGYMEVYIGSQVVGQWDPADARDHASNVLAVVAAAHLDTAYHGYLTGVVGLGSEEAKAVVDGLGKYMTRQWKDREVVAVSALPKVRVSLPPHPLLSG